ncbi:plasmid mobilization protein [Marinobacterium alkalitolerans]|uniref:plasmid mobilization protein n=1 Tax=Marinobacterium alkalitolerans TaxID=1542925 RepID=UPI0038B28A59
METRQKKAQIKVRISPDDKEQIRILANDSGMTPSGLLYEHGLSYQPHSKLDPKAIEKLSQLHAELNQVGDQLKD